MWFKKANLRESASADSSGCIIVKGAVQRAIAYTQNAISTAEPRGKGHGPLNHQVSLLPRLLPP